jgi:hypothetical protein
VIQRGVTIVLALILCACEAERTPLPVVVATQSPVVTVTQPPNENTVRYWVDPQLAGIIPSESVFSTPVTFATEWLGADSVDVVVGLDMLPSAELAPLTAPTGITLSFAVNTDQVPLTDPALAAWMYSAADLTGESTALKAQLAALGYPDGLTLTLYADDSTRPLLNSLVERFAQFGVQFILNTDSSDGAHLIAAVDTSAMPNVNWREIARFAIVYNSRFPTTFTERGFPIAVPQQN